MMNRPEHGREHAEASYRVESWSSRFSGRVWVLITMLGVIATVVLGWGCHGPQRHPGTHGLNTLRVHAHSHYCDTTWATPSPHTWCPFTGVRVGQAAVPGPGACCLDDPDMPDLIEPDSDSENLQPPPAQASDDEEPDWTEYQALERDDGGYVSDHADLDSPLIPAWMGNSGFMEQHIEEWQTAEDAVNLRPAPPRATRKRKPADDAATLIGDEEFAPGSLPCSIPGGYVCNGHACCK